METVKEREDQPKKKVKKARSKTVLKKTSKPPPRKVWTFISTKLGYSFPDPRDKMPDDPRERERWMPRIIRFIHGRYQTRDPDEAKAMIDRWKARKAANADPGYQPVTREVGDQYFAEQQPKITRGSLSTITAQATGERMPDFRDQPQEDDGFEESEDGKIELDSIEEEFAPAPDED